MLPYTARFDAEGRLSPASMVWLPLQDTVLPSTSCEVSAYVRTKGDLMSHGRPAVLAEGLEKSYGKNRALRGLDLAAEEGTVLGLLGPNGAGKTTAVPILATLLRPNAGRRSPGWTSCRGPRGCGRASALPAITPRSTST